MSTILLVTVGGSHAPIITAIQTLQPERVVFICSESSKSQVIGTGTPCEIRKGNEIIDRLPNIPTQVGMVEKMHISTSIFTTIQLHCGDRRTDSTHAIG